MIGVFDSGVGGLTVVKHLFQQLPTYQIIYFGDTARTPYGNRSAATINQYAQQDVDFLLKQGAKMVVVACNTVSAVALNNLKKHFSCPLFDVVAPAVKQAVAITRHKRIGIIGTRATINSAVYQQALAKIDKQIKVFAKPCPLLVPLVEEGWLKRPITRMIIKKYLFSLKQARIDTLILACTHFPLLMPIIQSKIGQQVRLVDSGLEMVLQIKQWLIAHPDVEQQLIKGKQHRFFVSDLTPNLKIMTNRWLGQQIKLINHQW